MTQTIQTDRRSCPSAHSFSNKLGRAAWGVVWVVLFRTSPVMFRGWRRFLLRCFGARLGKGVKVMPTTKIWAPWNLTMGEQACLAEHTDCYCVAPIEIGAHATVSQYTHLCAASHDISDKHMALIAAPIVIGAEAWVCAGAFVSMGVTIGHAAVVGARAVVTKDVEAWNVVGGNPARFIKMRSLKDAANHAS
jgi:putative colanic acid biosynthesis acetyltransferase WcaF